MSLPECPAQHSKAMGSHREQEEGGVCLGAPMGDGHPEVSPAIHPCLAMDGAALLWHGCFGTGTSREGALEPTLRMEVNTGRMGWALCSSPSSNDGSISHPGKNSSLTHLLPTWDAGKKPHPFTLPFSNLFVVGERL